MGAQKAALQLTGAAHGAAGTPHDLAGDDLAAAQGHALTGVAVADGVAKPGKHPGGIVHKGHGAYPGGRIPHPHPGAPLSGGAVPHGGQPGLELLTIADIDHLHRRACGRFQSIVHGIVRLGQGVVHAHHPVAQPQPGLLGGVCGAVRGVQVGKPTMSAPSENILTPKGVPHTVTTGRVSTRARTVLTGSHPPMDKVA